jgi:tRNA-2-methylthio-N6-dimethylallyladenosine synthase
MKYHLITYGCQMNTADSEEMAQPLRDRGFIATANPEQADVILMNTCTVREQAEHRAQSNLGRLKDWKAEDPQRVLIVAGCAASRWGDSIKKRYPYIDLVAPATKIEQFPELVAEVLKNRWDGVAENKNNFDGSMVGSMEGRTSHPSIHLSNQLFGDKATAYVTIMRGCNYSCTYCIVPQVRGREVYRSPQAILDEIQAKTQNGFQEVMLLGQTVNSYAARVDGVPLDFADLLRQVDALPGVERIRFMSPHPRYMRDRVIAAMRDSRKVCRHIHLPMQSGSDTVLARMSRLYTRTEYLSIIHKLRLAMPGILITTDVIVGFPGESPAEFEETLALMRDIAFEGLFAFKFSPRPGTAAAELADDVPETAKEDRLQQVLALNKTIQAQNRVEVAG